MSLFTVDAEKCKRDGHCVRECPVMIIQMKDPDSVPTPVPGAEQKCIRCGHCVAVCPHGALSLGFMSTDECPPVRKELALGPDEVEHFLRSRRSIRSFKDKPLEADVLKALIDTARYGPTGSNSQQVGWIAIVDTAELQRLTGLAIDWMRDMVQKKVPQAEAYGMAGIVKAWEGGIDIICRGAPALVAVHAPADYMAGAADCTIALSYFDLAAPAHGLGTCWAGFFMFAAAHWPPLKEALRLPEGHALHGAMMVGYPRHRFHRLPLRREAPIDFR